MNASLQELFLDLTRAFDMIDVICLLYKLPCLGMDVTYTNNGLNHISETENKSMHGYHIYKRARVISPGVITQPILLRMFVSDLLDFSGNCQIMLCVVDIAVMYGDPNPIIIRPALKKNVKKAAKV